MIKAEKVHAWHLCGCQFDVYSTLSPLAVIEIGFEMNNYTVWEAPNTTIAVCCKILHTNLTLGRPLEIGALVLSNLTTATGKLLYLANLVIHLFVNVVLPLLAVLQ